MPADMISVVIPVFNGALFLASTIENVLAQGINDLEIIVVNDGSTDKSEAVALSFSQYITYLKQANKGPSAARNLGIQHANGKYLAFLDYDDVWSDSNLMTLLNAFEPSVDIVMGQIQEEHFDHAQQTWIPCREVTFSPSLVAMLARRTAFEIVGLLDETITIGEDKDWFYRSRESNLVIKYLKNHVALHHRRHNSNITNNMEAPEHYLLSLMRQSLKRRGVFR